MKQPRMLSNEEWEVVGEACGFIHKTYEEYREWKQQRVKWAKGNLAWGVSSEKVFPLANIDDRLFDAVRHNIQPPTKDQLTNYQNDPVEICEAARKVKGDEYFTEKGLAWVRGLDKLDADAVGDPANTCSPPFVSPADFEEFLESQKAVKEESKPGINRMPKLISPNKKLFKAGDVVANDGEIGKVTKYDPDAYENCAGVDVRSASGELWGWPVPDTFYASPDQVDEFCTIKIDGVEYRFYVCNGQHYYYTGKHEIHKYGIGSLSSHFVNQHYRHLVLPVDDLEKMLPPVVKGE